MFQIAINSSGDIPLEQFWDIVMFATTKPSMNFQSLSKDQMKVSQLLALYPILRPLKTIKNTPYVPPRLWP